MNYVQPKVFDITKKRPAVLLVGNGLNRCAGDSTSWDNAIQRLAKDDAVLDKIDHINYSIRATVTADTDEHKRWPRYQKLFGDNFVLPDNPLLQKLLEIPFDAVLTTNYTYELENALDSSYPLSEHKGNHACVTVQKPETGRQPDDVRLLNTFNRFSRDRKNIDIWHVHGEVREPASMILTHEEYGRLVAELVKRENDQTDPTRVSFESWMDYFIYGDLYVLGQGINFAEFDLWWLLSRRNSVKGSSARSVFYAPMQHDRNLNEVEEALTQIGMKLVNFGKILPDFEKVSRAEINDFFFKFYTTATYDLAYRIEKPTPFETEKLIDYRDKCMENPTKSNRLRLLYQLSKTEVYLLGENVKSRVTQSVKFLPIKADKKYDVSHAVFLFSTEDSYPGVVLNGQELRKMTGLEALNLAQADGKVDSIFLDLQGTRKGVWFPMRQAEYMRHDPEELKGYEKEANEKDLARRKMNAKKASEPAHYIKSFISNNSFPESLEEAAADIENMGYFNYEAVLHKPEVHWTSPKSTQVGDIVFFAHTKNAKEKILFLQSELKKTKKYPKLGSELKRALSNYEKYGGKIFAIGQVCEIPEEISPDDPFYVDQDKKHWHSKYYSGITNIIELDHSVDYSEYKHIVKLQQRSYTMVSGDAFAELREVIQKKNRKMKFPLYFLKSTVSQTAAEDEEESADLPDAFSEKKADENKDVSAVTEEKTPDETAELPETSEPDHDITLSGLLTEAGVEIIDKRDSGGLLWIIGGKELDPLVRRCKEIGVTFRFKAGGGKVCKGRDAWWTKDRE